MDLIPKAINKGFILKNKDYYLWEIQRWLREEHNIHIVVIPFARDSSNIKSKSDYYVYVNKKQFYGFINITANDKPYKTHEEALEQGLIEALKLIK